MENYGQLKVYDSKDKPLPQVYVKCYANKGSTTTFYKDGYTDLRGSFDYVSLNSTKIDSIEKFFLLIQSDKLGSQITKVGAPSQIGRVEDYNAIKSTNTKYSSYQNDPFQKEYMSKFSKKKKK